MPGGRAAGSPRVPIRSPRRQRAYPILVTLVTREAPFHARGPRGAGASDGRPTKIRASGANAIIRGNWGADIVGLGKAIIESGVDVPIYTYHAAWDGITATFGENGVGVIRLVHEGKQNPSTDEYTACFKAFEARHPEQGLNQPRIVNGMQMLARAIDAAGSTDPAAVAAKLEGMEHTPMLGSRRAVRFTGRELAGRRSHQIACSGLGYVPENRDIFPTLTVRQNLVLGMKRVSRAGARALPRSAVRATMRRFSSLQAQISSLGRPCSSEEVAHSVIPCWFVRSNRRRREAREPVRLRRASSSRDGRRRRRIQAARNRLFREERTGTYSQRSRGRRTGSLAVQSNRRRNPEPTSPTSP